MKTGTAPQPLYQAIKSYVLEQIDSGDWRPGARIPSEAEIVRQQGVSRMTVHRAFRELTAEGRLVRMQGVGTFVAKPRPQGALLEIRSIADEILARGGDHACRVVVAKKARAGELVAAALEIAPGSTVFYLLLVHSEDGKPVQIEDRYVNLRVVPGISRQNFETVTTSQYLLQNVPATELEHHIEARLPSEDESGLLGIPMSEPCLVVTRRSWAGREVVTRVRFVYPGARYGLGGRYRTDRTNLALVA